MSDADLWRVDWWYPSRYPPKPPQRAPHDTEHDATQHAHTLNQQGAQTVIYPIRIEETTP